LLGAGRKNFVLSAMVPYEPEHAGSKPCILDTSKMVHPKNEKSVEYRLMKLGNGLEALLISDPDTDKSSAAVDVRVGYLSDPSDMPGLAHFTEHMLFYSSEKYPEEDEYSKFVSEHGGFCNAFTAAEDTNYHFDVNNADFEPALDRFAQFFVAPLISKDGVSREMKAVDSENSKNLNSDAWRSMQLWKHVAKPDHVFHKFGTGNIETLKHTPESNGIDTHEQMLKFYSAHYSANLMKLCCYSNQSLDELETMVASKFSAVKTLGKDADKFTDIPFAGEHHEGKMIKVSPIRDMDQLDFQWLIPSEEEAYRFTPCHYLSHLIGHEGDGSILKLLKDLKWASSLSAGPSPESYSSHSLFLVSVDLTKEGNKHVEEIAKIVFQYVEMLCEEGIQTWIFEELKNIGETQFHFRDKRNPGRYTQNVASGMQLYEPDDLLMALHHVPLEYSEDSIKEILKCLTVEKVRMMWSSQDHKGKTSEVEPWYGTEYVLESLSEAFAGALKGCGRNEKLRLPTPNRFIPTDFSLISKDESFDTPQLIHESKMSKLWYKPDTLFNTPKGQVYLSLISPESYTSPEAAVCTNLLTKMLIDSMNEVVYYAEVAGLFYSISSTTVGLQLAFSGYSHKLLTLAEDVVKRLLAFKPNAERFEILKEVMTKDFENTKFDQPYQQGIYSTSLLCLQKKWQIKEYLEVLPRLRFEDFQAFLPKLMSRVSNQLLILGNLTAEQGVAFVQTLEGLLEKELNTQPIFASQVPEKRVIMLEGGKNYAYSQEVANEEEENGSLNVAFQIGMDSFKTNVLMQLWLQIVERSAFHSLRSVEQIGYIVVVFSYDFHQVRNVYFLLQSTSHHPVRIDSLVEKFLIEFQTRLDEMEEKEFDDQRNSLISVKSEKLKTLSEEGKRYWREIDEGGLHFKRQDLEVEELKKITKEDLVAFSKTQFDANSTSRRKLSVRVVSAKAEEIKEDLQAEDKERHISIQDMQEFKRGLPVFPAK
jgi:insulysin